MNNLRTGRYIVLLLIINLFLAVAIGYLFYDLKNSRLVEINNLSLELAHLRDIGRSSTGLDWVIRGSQYDRERLDMYFITRDTIQDFEAELGATAQSVGAALRLGATSVMSDSVVPQNFLRMGLTVEGEPVKVARFLDALEKMPYKLRFNRVDIKKGKTSWKASVDMDLISYIDE